MGILSAVNKLVQSLVGWVTLWLLMSGGYSYLLLKAPRFAELGWAEIALLAIALALATLLILSLAVAIGGHGFRLWKPQLAVAAPVPPPAESTHSAPDPTWLQLQLHEATEGLVKKKDFHELAAELADLETRVWPAVLKWRQDRAKVLIERIEHSKWKPPNIQPGTGIGYTPPRYDLSHLTETHFAQLGISAEEMRAARDAAMAEAKGNAIYCTITEADAAHWENPRLKQTFHVHNAGLDGLIQLLEEKTKGD